MKMGKYCHKVCPLRPLKGELLFGFAEKKQAVPGRVPPLGGGGGKLFTFCLFLLISTSTFSQDSLNLKHLRSFPLTAKFATADQLNNFYLITPENEILKLDSLGNEQFRFSNNRLGDIASFDASNPFNLLVFYKDFNIVKILDRTLTESGEFNLFEAEIFQTPCVGISADKNLWIYDRDNFQLKKIDKNGKTIVESRQLNLLFDENLNPIILRESENKVYLLDPEIGLFVFDIFGRFLNKIQISQTIDFQAFENKILFLQKEKLTSFSSISFFEKEFLLPQKLNTEKSIFLNRNLIFLIEKESVNVFRF